jgi:hypothetical protein
MTIYEIKRELPPVYIKIFNTTIQAAISGRQLKYPIVHCNFLGINHAWEFSWEAIERAINTNTVLII